jgi:hypothetical protein
LRATILARGYGSLRSQGRQDGACTLASYSNVKQPIPSLRDTTPLSRDAMRPSCARNVRPEMRAWGMPGARCTRSRAWCVVNTRVSHHGRTGSPGIPARNGFNGFLRALPGDRALLSPSLANESANLTPASRRQDHTTSPSAPAPFVHSASASTASRSNVRDDRETPLMWDGMARDMDLIWGKREGKYFLRWDWTGGIRLIRFNKFAVARKSVKWGARASGTASVGVTP